MNHRKLLEETIFAFSDIVYVDMKPKATISLLTVRKGSRGKEAKKQNAGSSNCRDRR